MARHAIVAVLWSLAMLMPVAAQAEKRFELGLDAGASAVTGADFENLGVGYDISGDIAYRFVKYLLADLRVEYTQWFPLRASFLKSVSGAISGAEADGSVWTLSVVPSLRVTTRLPGNLVNLFASAGAGLYVISNDITIDAVIVGPAGNVLTEIREVGTGTDAHFGTAFGGGVAVGEGKPVRVRLYSIWNYVVRDESPDQYVSVSLGFVWVL